MLTYFFERMMAFLFGKGTAFTSYDNRDVSLATGRLFVRLEWTNYKRWGGLFRLYLRKVGLLKVTMAFNPGVPDFEFKASCSSTEYPDYIVIGKKEVMDAEEFEELQDELEDMDDLPEGVLCMQWRCVTVVRSAEDLMELYDWLEDIESTLSEDGDEYEDGEYDSPFDCNELELIEDSMSMLTERFSECQLNS